MRTGAAGAIGLTLGDLVSARARAAGASPPARAVIVLWLWGGPSHLDTFDMKPDAPAEYRGPFEPIATAVPGLHVCELLPGLARRADRFALLRAMHHESNDHGIAGTIALTGSIAGAVGLGGAANTQAMRPSTGAIVGRLHRREAGSLPPYVILGSPLHQGLKRAVGEGGGSLGSTFDPFRLDYEPGAGLKLPDVGLPEGVSAARLGARWGLAPGHRAESSGPAGRRTGRAAEAAVRPGAHADRLARGPRGPRRRPRAGAGARGIRAAPVRPVLSDRPPARRGGHSVRPGQLEHARRGPRGRWRRRLGHARPLFPGHAGPARLDVRPGALGPARRPPRPRLAGFDAGRRGGRVRPHAQDQRPRGPRPLEHLLLGPPGRRRRARRPGSSGPRTAAASTRPTGR